MSEVDECRVLHSRHVCAWTVLIRRYQKPGIRRKIYTSQVALTWALFPGCVPQAGLCNKMRDLMSAGINRGFSLYLKKNQTSSQQTHTEPLREVLKPSIPAMVRMNVEDKDTW